MSVKHFAVFLPCQKLHSNTLLHQKFRVVVGRGPDDVKVAVHELVVKMPRRAKVQQRRDASVRVVQEVAPVWIGLHELPVKQLEDGESEDSARDLVALGLREWIKFSLV